MRGVLGANMGIPISELGSERVERIKADLCLRQKSGRKWGFGEGGVVNMFSQTGDVIEVPRAYALGEMGIADFEDRTVGGEPISFVFTKSLRDEQPDLLVSFMGKFGRGAACPEAYGGIMAARCGVGKTVLALKILSEIGRPAIVLVHNATLLKQWIRKIREFTDIPDDAIGSVREEKCEWRGKKIVVAMVESIVSRRYEEDMYRHFGVLVIDEVHRHAAVSWHRATTQFPARLRIGLSATPRRSDGLWNVIKWNIGGVLASGGKVEPATVYQLYTGVILSPRCYEIPSKDPEDDDPGVSLSRLTNALVGIRSRNEFIAAQIFKAVDGGRRSLVLSSRLEHLDCLRELFERMWAGRPPVGIGRYVGGIKDADVEEAQRSQIVFGTYQYAKDALDDPSLDTLMLATPVADVEQAGGRVVRKLSGKRRPYIIDFCDEMVDPCRRFMHKRRRQYRELGHTLVVIKDPERPPRGAV